MHLKRAHWLVLASALGAGLAACGGGNPATDGGGNDVVNADSGTTDGGGGEGGMMDGGTGDGGMGDGGGTTDGGMGGDGGGTTDGGGGGGDGGGGGGCTPVGAIDAAGGTVSGTLGPAGTGQLTALGCSDPSVSDLTTGEQVYTLHVTQSTYFTFDATATDANLDLVLAVRGMCDVDTSEVSCNDDGGPGVNPSLHTLLDPGDYVVIVDAYDPTDVTDLSFTLTTAASTPAPNASCSAPTALTAGTPLTNQNSAGGVTPSDACESFNDGGQLFYTLDIPAGQRATITATPTGTTTWTPVVRVLDTCDATACLADAAANTAGQPASVHFDNRGTTTRTVIVSVSGSSPTDNGTFDLSATLAAAPPIPTNAMCSMATTVAAGTPVTNQDPSLGTDDLSSACESFANGPVLYYRASVPPGQTLTATATPSASLDVAVRLLSACGATSCLASADNTSAGMAESVVHTNAGTTVEDIIIAVGAGDPGMTGTFDLSVTVAAPPANALCTAATPVTNGAMLTNQNSTASASTLSSVCASGAAGGVLYYRAVVPAGQTLTINVMPTNDMDAVIRLLADCTATTCVANVDATGRGGAETLTHMNTTATPETLVFAVGDYYADDPATFDLGVMIQ